MMARHSGLQKIEALESKYEQLLQIFIPPTKVIKQVSILLMPISASLKIISISLFKSTGKINYHEN